MRGAVDDPENFDIEEYLAATNGLLGQLAAQTAWRVTRVVAGKPNLAPRTEPVPQTISPTECGGR